MLFPLFKKEDRSLAKKYQPIALLSHIKNLIEKTLDSRLSREYKFATQQGGFQREPAILRISVAHRVGWNSAVVLDMKSAYQTVLRDKLMREISTFVSGNLSQIEQLQAENIILTIWDFTEHTRRMFWGMTQGSPLSPHLLACTLALL